MRLTLLFPLFMLPAPAAAQSPRQAPAAVEYAIEFPNAAHHEAEVTVTFRGLPARALEVRMSRSSPGRYALHEFAKNVYAVRARDGRGRELPVSMPDNHGWTVSGHDGTVAFSYTLFADRGDGTYSQIDRSHAHLLMPATFAFARGLERRPVTLTIRPADPRWQVATQLRPTADPLTFTAPNLQYFFDSPTEVAELAWRSWTVTTGNRTDTIRVAMHHLGTDEELDRYTEAARRIVTEQTAIYGVLPRFDFGTYTFLACYLPWAAGDGMEHRNSTTLTSTASLANAMNGLLGTVSHEFFHAWNVERIRPRSLEPFDFERANMSDMLWLAEGFTSYYGPLAMVRSGVIDGAQYGAIISGAVNALLNAPGRRYYGAAGMSRQAPFVDAAASIDATNRVNTFISYYTYGNGLGLALDLTIRGRFPGRSLDDVMREMWRRHGVTERPYTMDDWVAALGAATGDAAFAADFNRRYIVGQESPDFAALLGAAGFVVRPARAGAAWAGDVQWRADSAGAVLTSATQVGTPLYQAGLDRGDRIILLAGRGVRTAGDYAAVLGAQRPGDEVPVRFESRGHTVEAVIRLAESPAVQVMRFEEAGLEVSAAAREFRRAWLGSRAGY